MRFAVGLLACLGAGAVTSALADPQIEAQSAPAAAVAPVPSASAAPAPAPAAATATADAKTAPPEKPAVDPDVMHFMQEGYRPEMRHGQKLYCKKEVVLGSRLNAKKTCGTIEELKMVERRTRLDVEQAQQRQSNGPTGR
jgi:hypothetical protein